ncbi:CHASE2 domain-containing sensor protein [Oikeobacillus pervagus]|uniref:CHASE2 domain-containing sensor protein n=1 Tax=Oikeobacillus pervagus TaxID=1325931 RepID=A0AAJ1SZP1_9BACI|nr:CHASE2 domain-containing sensor protein [Oikeobacillus pervagus]
MMIWIILTIISPLLAFICWYAKGKGILAISISSIIFMFISRQAFIFGFWYFDIRNILELLIWIAMIFVLYQSPKQTIRMISIGLFLYLLTAQINLFWGML